MRLIYAPLRSAFAFVVLVACAGEPTSPAQGLRFLSGATGSDTILAMRPEPLVVEVRDDAGQLVPGATVTFSVTPVAPVADRNRRLFLCPIYNSVCAAFSEPTGQSSWQTEVTTTTDTAGVARVRVQHGRIAGAATVEVSVASRGLTASAPFETLVGNIASIVVGSADTAVYVGASYDLNPKAADRYGNVRPEPVSAQTLTPAVATLANGRVTAVSVGRASFALTAGAVSRTALVSVPPSGRLLASGAPSGTSAISLLLLDTDGRSRRTVATTPGVLGYGYPAWYPDGRITTLEYSAQTHPQVVAFDTTSGARSMPIDPAIFTTSYAPTASKASGLMYFTGTRDGVFGIHGATLDGSPTAFYLQGQSPSVSPDGLRMAYLPSTSTTQVVVRDLATGAETPLGPAQYGPFWSPAGDLIAYLGGPPGGDFDVHVVRPDGTGNRIVATSVYSAESWSPDGQWIATCRRDVGIELVRVSDGMRLPIPQTRELTQVSWRP